MNANQLINYMERLRYERNLTQEKYLHGIVSNRQYFRYRNEESEAPFDIVEKLSQRLEIPIFRLIAQFQEEQQQEKKLVRDYINFVIHQQLDNAEILFEQLRSVRTLDEHSLRFVQLGKQLCEYYRDRLSKLELVSRIKEIISVDEMLKRTSIHDIELYMLGVLMNYSDQDRSRVLAFILSLYRNHKLMTGGNPIYVSQISFWIIKNLGREQRFEEVIEFCNEAIDFCRRNYSFYALENFYYFQALAYRKLHDEDRFFKSLIKTLEIIPLLGEEKQQRFKAMIEKDLGIHIENHDYKDVLQETIKNLAK